MTLLVGRVTVFLRRIGEVTGFDPGPHFQMLEILSWVHPNTEIHGSFYGYHPPLGFLIPHSIQMLFRVSPELSVQWTSFLAGLATFFFLRETLRHCHLLHRPSGIAFLYLASSIPIQISVGSSVNLDVMTLAIGAAVLWISVRIHWPRAVFEDSNHPKMPQKLTHGHYDPHAKRQKDRVAFLCAALAGAALTKFSGVLLLAIPAFVALAQPYRHGWWRRCAIGTTGCALAVVLVFPYYYTRYYMPEGKFFPLNTEWSAAGQVQDAITEREKDPAKFFTELFKPTTVHAAQGPTIADNQVNRLADTWRDIWLRNHHMGKTTSGALYAGLAYMGIAPWLMLIGMLIFLRRIRHRTYWMRFGWVVLGFSLVQLAALIQFIYRVPFAGWYPAKGLYVLPIIWGIAYLIVTAFSDDRIVPLVLRQHTPLLQHALIGMVAVFVILNHGIPAY